jgi:hypothetical protein
MNALALTPLEQFILAEFLREYPEAALPSRISARVVSRQSTGAGRFTELLTDPVRLSDGWHGLSGGFTMEGLRFGLTAAVHVTGSRIDTLDIAVIGDDRWDGVERPWTRDGVEGAS